MPRLTKRVVDHLQPRLQEYFVWEETLPGFGLRLFPSGRKTYLVQYRDAHGHTRRYTLGPHGVLTPDQARVLAQEALARVRAGDDPQHTRQAARRVITVTQLAQRVLEATTLRPKTAQEYRGLLRRHILPAFGSVMVPAVTREDM